MNQNEDISQPRPDLKREIAGIGAGRDITRGYLGPYLVPQDLLLESRGGDLRLYEGIRSEALVHSTLQQRRNAVIKCAWGVRPGGDAPIDQEAADFLKRQLQGINFDRATAGMHWGVFYGYAVAEMIYGQEGRFVTLEAIKVRNRRRFQFDDNAQLRLKTFANMMPGESAPPPYFWNFRTGADHDDEPYGLGLAHWLYWPVYFLRNGVKFWLIFLEKFGMPTAVGKYDQQASAEERQKLLAAAAAIQTDAGVIMPKEMELDLLEAARSGTVDYVTLHETMEAIIAKVVLGQTLTSQVGSNGGNSRGLGNVHMEVRQDLVKADADLICESFNLGPARWLTEWNFPGAAIPEVFRDVEEPEDLKTRADRDSVISSMGFKPKLDYISETYGGDWTETAAPPDPVPPQRGKDVSYAEATDLPPDPAARMSPRLDDALAPTMDDWIGKIKNLVDNAQSLEEVRDGLVKLAPEMSLDQYSVAMRQALAAAALAGRYEILREASI